MPLTHRQAWGINHLSRKPLPMFDHRLGKEMLPNHVKSETPLTDATLNHSHTFCPTHSVPGSQEEELGTSLSTSPPQEAAESNEVEVVPQPLLLQMRQTQSPQPFLIGSVLLPAKHHEHQTIFQDKFHTEMVGGVDFPLSTAMGSFQLKRTLITQQNFKVDHFGILACLFVKSTSGYCSLYVIGSSS